MRAVVQRVTAARVRVTDPDPDPDPGVVGEIGPGLLVLVGIGREDGPDDVKYIAGKLRDLRIFDGADGKGMDRSVTDVGGGILVVSQFTLYGDVRRGRRPSFDAAASPAAARDLYEALVRELRTTQLTIATGEFQAMMHVELVNDGPVTVLIDSQKRF
jgi:D-tyrosyl-tRNA(Tyr) deacylase